MTSDEAAFLEWGEAFEKWAAPGRRGFLRDLRAAWAAATAHERERCAKVLEADAESSRTEAAGMNDAEFADLRFEADVAERLAARIREGL